MGTFLSIFICFGALLILCGIGGLIYFTIRFALDRDFGFAFLSLLSTAFVVFAVLAILEKFGIL